MRNLTLFAAALALAACSPDAHPEARPTLLAVPESSIAVGQPVTFLGAAFTFTKDVRTEIELAGLFTSESGRVQPVPALRVPPHLQDENTLVLTNFGPFANSFSSSGDELGTFNGVATAVIVGRDGSGDKARSEPLPVTITVGPSIVVRELEPTENAACPAPVKRVLGGFYYRMKVSAVGFKPINFTWKISGEPGFVEPRIYRAAASGQDGVIGDGEAHFVFVPVPHDLSFYTANLELSALADDGTLHTTRYVFGVHNPIEYITTGAPEQAEIYAAVPVLDSCYSGGINGSSQSWTESHEDSVQRGTTETFDQSWTMAHSTSTSATTTNQVSVQYSDSHTDGWQAGWNSNSTTTNEFGVSLTASYGFDVGIMPFGIGASGHVSESGTEQASNSVSDSFGDNFEANRSDTHQSTVGHDYSESDTEQSSYEQSQSLTKGKQFSWTETSSDTSSHTGEVMVLPGRYLMMYRQRIRVEYPAEIRAFDLCGGSQVVARASFTNWTWAYYPEQGASCPPPPVDVPAAQCFLDCSN